MRAPLAAVAVAGLVAGACGSDAPESVEERLPDADELIEEAESLGVTPLALALDQTASATSYRLEMSMGMSMSMAGESMNFDADPSTPMFVVDVDADGESYGVMDLGPMMSSMAASSGEDLGALGFDDLSMEMWQSGSTMYLDVTGFGALLAQAGSPFPSDRFSIDLTALGDSLGSADIASALSGQTAPDPIEMATVLREALGDVQELDDGSTFTGTIGFFDYARAFGQDPAAMTGMGSGGLGGPAAEAMVEQMMDAFDDVEADVTVTIADDAVDLVRFDIDLSAFFDEFMSSMADSFGEDPPPGMFDDIEMAMTMLLDYDLDPMIDVEVPDAADFPDATDDFVSMYGDVLDA